MCETKNDSLNFSETFFKTFETFLLNLNTEFNIDLYKHIRHLSVIEKKFSKLVETKIIDLDEFMNLEFPRISKLTGYQLFLDEIKNSSIFKNYISETKKSSSDESILLLKIVVLNYLKQKEQFEYDEEILKKILFSLKKYLLFEHLYLYCYIPMYGLSGDFERFDFSNSFKIRKITSIEFDKITNLNLINSKFVDRKFQNLEYVLEIKFDPIDEQLSKITKPILESLRLLKSGKLHLGAAYPFIPGLVGFTSLRPKLGDENPPELDTLLEFDESEFERFLKIYHDLIDLRKNFDDKKIRYINFALDRFGKFYDDVNTEDKITDLAITLETLLNKESFEVTLRLSIVSSLLLGEDESDREFLYKFINKCYSVRSEIVHGKERTKIKIQGKEYSDNSLCTLLEQKTRMAILRIIKLHKKFKTQDELITNLLTLVVNREKLKEFFKTS